MNKEKLFKIGLVSQSNETKFQYVIVNNDAVAWNHAKGLYENFSFRNVSVEKLQYDDLRRVPSPTKSN
ncbi:MAG: hypothetical protein RBT11_01220 [Desulfobacterales bacterium]|jgi:hypothetical protein|nr:hypothetical protein [Desulfobacterales bacterium]